MELIEQERVINERLNRDRRRFDDYQCPVSHMPPSLGNVSNKPYFKSPSPADSKKEEIEKLATQVEKLREDFAHLTEQQNIINENNAQRVESLRNTFILILIVLHLAYVLYIFLLQLSFENISLFIISKLEGI